MSKQRGGYDTFRQGKHQTKYLQHKDKLRTSPATIEYKQRFDQIKWKKRAVADKA